jgi:hypothetical protein
LGRLRKPGREAQQRTPHGFPRDFGKVSMRDTKMNLKNLTMGHVLLLKSNPQNKAIRWGRGRVHACLNRRFGGLLALPSRHFVKSTIFVNF